MDLSQMTDEQLQQAKMDALLAYMHSASVSELLELAAQLEKEVQARREKSQEDREALSALGVKE